ncbi:MAG TPA: hypothetical protein VFU88_20385 [Ktedonobacterales bacterium]|nr:hypothetical protein [Ktedonobacterales bacterium]
MAVLQSTVIRRLDTAGAIRLAELLLISLSNNVVAAITGAQDWICTRCSRSACTSMPRSAT